LAVHRRLRRIAIVVGGARPSPRIRCERVDRPLAQEPGSLALGTVPLERGRRAGRPTWRKVGRRRRLARSEVGLDPNQRRGETDSGPVVAGELVEAHRDPAPLLEVVETALYDIARSEERRVGKEGRTRWSA